MVSKIFVACIIGLIVISAFVVALVFHMVAKPSGRNVFANCGGTDNVIGYDYEILSNTASDDVRLNAYFVDNDNSDCLIVVLHGYGS